MSAADVQPAPTPEQRLMAAIVRRAIWDFVYYKDVCVTEKPAQYGLAVDAAGWLFWDGEETTDEHGRITFLHICDTLNIEPQRVRYRIMKLRREDVKRLHNSFKEP